MIFELNLDFDRITAASDAVVFQFRLKNGTDSDARILGLQFELWQTSDMNGNRERRIGELRLDAQAMISDSHTRFKAALKPDEETSLHLFWPVSPDDLQKIEDHRAGMSPIFRIRPLFLVESVSRTGGGGGQERAELGWNGPNCGNGWPLWLKVPDYDWIGVLDKLKFKHNTLDRLKWPSLPPVFARSEEHLADAWERHRKGDVEGTIVSCYKAIECLNFNVSGGGGMNHEEVLALLMDGAHAEKRTEIMKLMQQLKSFFHLARHERGAPVTLTYLDAQLAVVCTTAVMAYLGPQYRDNTRA